MAALLSPPRPSSAAKLYYGLNISYAWRVFYWDERAQFLLQVCHFFAPLQPLFPASESLSMLLQKPIVPSWEKNEELPSSFVSMPLYWILHAFPNVLGFDINQNITDCMTSFLLKCICSDCGIESSRQLRNVAINHRQEDQALQVTLYPILFYCAKLSLLSLLL